MAKEFSVILERDADGYYVASRSAARPTLFLDRGAAGEGALAEKAASGAVAAAGCSVGARLPGSSGGSTL